jgi:regulator of sirC expression with transglutaminase-like and TPR domain
MAIRSFSELAVDAQAHVDELALALAAELRDLVDADWALARLDELGEEVARVGGDGLDALHEVLGCRYGFIGDRDEYDHPDNSMLDLVLERRTGLPIILSVYTRRNDLGRAIRAAELRLELLLQRTLAEALGAELRALRARLN